MIDPMFWPTIAWGLGCFTVFYGYALRIECRQKRERRAQLQGRLTHPLTRLALSRIGTIATDKPDQGEATATDMRPSEKSQKPRRFASKIAAVAALDEIRTGL